MAEQPIHISAPFSGIDESRSSKQIAANALTVMRNMVFADGKPTPRPGYERATELNISIAPFVITADTVPHGPIEFSTVDGVLFYVERNGASYRIAMRITSETITTDALFIGTTVIHDISIDAVNKRLYYLFGNAIRSVSYYTASAPNPFVFSDIQVVISDARNGTGVPPTAIEIDSANEYIYWTTGRHLRRAELDGSNATTLVDGGANNTVVMLATDVANSHLYFTNNVSASLIRVDLSGSGAQTVVTLASGRVFGGISINTVSANDDRIVYTQYDEASPQVRRLTTRANDLTVTRHIATNEEFQQPLNAILSGLSVAGGYAFVVADAMTEGRILMFSMSPVGSRRIVSTYPIQRALLGSENTESIRDMLLFQVRDDALLHSDYGLWISGADKAYLLRTGWTKSFDPDIPDIWCVNTRDAHPDFNEPMSRSAFPANYIYQGRYGNTGRGGITVLDGGVSECESRNFGTTIEVVPADPGQNEIQVLSIAGLGGGNWKIRVDYGTVGDADSTSVINISSDLADNADAAAVKTVLELLFSTYTPFATSAEFTVTGGAGGPWTVEFTGDYAGIGFPIMAAVDSGTPENINPADRTQLGQTPSETIIEEVHSFSLVGGSSVLDEFYFTFFDDDLEVQTPNLTRNSTAADVRAAFGLTYTASNLDVSVTGAGTMSWSCTIRYTGDYAGRTFNLPVFEFVAPMSWSLAMVKEERTVRGSGVEVEPASSFPANIGLGKEDSPYVFNYVLGDTIQKFTMDGDGPVVLRFLTDVTEILFPFPTADELKAALEAIPNIDYVIVNAGSGSPREYVIQFSGVWSGKCAPLLSVDTPVWPDTEPDPPAAGGGSVEMLRDGGKEDGHIAYMRPVGLPRPLRVDAVEGPRSRPEIISVTSDDAEHMLIQLDFGSRGRTAGIAIAATSDSYAQSPVHVRDAFENPGTTQFKVTVRQYIDADDSTITGWIITFRRPPNIVVPLPTPIILVGDADKFSLNYRGRNYGAGSGVAPSQARISGNVSINATNSYVVTFWSPIFGLESPMSPESELIGVVNQSTNLQIPIPDNIWFDNTIVPFTDTIPVANHPRIIPRIRIYRKKHGRVNRTNTVWRMVHNYHARYLTFSLTMDNGNETGLITMKDNNYTDITSSDEAEITAAFFEAGYEVVVSRASELDSDDIWLVEFIGDRSGSSVGYIDKTDDAGSGVVNINQLFKIGGEVTELDGVGATGDWFFLDEIDIDPANIGGFQDYEDTIGDADFIPSFPAPFMNEYPPAQSRIGCAYNGMSIYTTGLPGDRNIWISELPKQGSLNFGELGHEYVAPNSFEEIVQLKPTDAPLTAIFPYQEAVAVGNGTSIVRADIVPRVDPANSRFTPIDGIIGFACQRCVVEARLPSDPMPRLLWVNPDGLIYSYMAGQSTLFSDKLTRTARTLIRRYWQKALDFADTKSWILCSAVYDDVEWRVIFTGIIEATGEAIQMVFDLNNGGAASLWTIPSTLFWSQREWDTDKGQKFQNIIMFASGTHLYRMVQNGDDNGTPIACVLETGDMPIIDGFTEALVKTIGLEFDMVLSTGPSPEAPEMTLTVYLDKRPTPFPRYTHEDEAAFRAREETYLAFTGQLARCRRIRIAWAVNHEANRDRPELLAINTLVDATGRNTR